MLLDLSRGDFGSCYFVFTSDYDIHAFAGCSMAFARYTKDLLHHSIKIIKITTRDVESCSRLWEQ